eukprot:scaffold150785_cov29-Prasinocladus_malaysianus.AAC.5
MRMLYSEGSREVPDVDDGPALADSPDLHAQSHHVERGELLNCAERGPGLTLGLVLQIKVEAGEPVEEHGEVQTSIVQEGAVIFLQIASLAPTSYQSIRKCALCLA